MTIKQCITVKSTLHSSAVVFSACEIITVFSVVFYVVRVVQKSDFRLILGETPNKCDQCEVTDAVISTDFF